MSFAFFVENSVGLEEDFPGAYVEHAVVEALGEAWPFAVDEFSIVVNRISSEDDFVFISRIGCDCGVHEVFIDPS